MDLWERHANYMELNWMMIMGINRIDVPSALGAEFHEISPAVQIVSRDYETLGKVTCYPFSADSTSCISAL
jgi:hypothetical protein